MANSHPIYPIIKSLNGPEKAYFKKFAFKKESKNNESLKRIFDLIDKQADFDKSLLLKDKKINQSVKSSLHVSLNYLQKRIVKSLLDYQKTNSELAKIFDLILEIELYIEKGLLTAAQNKLSYLDAQIVSNDHYQFQPYITSLHVKIARLSPKLDLDLRASLLKRYEDCLEDFNVLSQTEKIGLTLENFYLKNGGIKITNEADRELAARLRDQTSELMDRNDQDLQLKSILINNMYVLHMMIGSAKDLVDLSSTIITFYKEQVEKRESEVAIYDFIVVLINLSFVTVLFNDASIFNESIKILDAEQKNLANPSVADNLEKQISTLRTLSFAMNPFQELTNSKWLEILNYLGSLDFEHTLYRNTLLGVSIIYLRQGKFQEILDVSSEYFQLMPKTFNETSLIPNRVLRAIAWLRLENLKMFDYEIQIAYKYALERKDIPFIAKAVNYVKFLGTSRDKTTKTDKYNKIKTTYRAMEETNSAPSLISSKAYDVIIEAERNLNA